LPLSLLKCGLTAPEIAEIGNIWYKFVQKGYTPLSDFLQKISAGEDVPGPYSHAKFHRCGFRNVGLQPPKSRKMVIVGVNLPLRENLGGPQKNIE